MPHPVEIIPDGEPDATEGHDLVHEDLAEWWNSQEGTLHINVPAGANQASVQAAVAAAHAAGGGVVELVGPSYTLSASPALTVSLPTVSIVGQGSGATVINYTGSGDCIRVQPSPTTVVQMGVLRGFTIDGSGSSAGAKGVHHVDSGTTMASDDVVIRDFAGAGSVGACIENVSLWNERAAGSRLQLANNTIGLQLIGTGSNNSVFYHRWVDLRLNVGAGQIGVQLKGTALAQGGDWNVLGNIDGTGGIFFDLADSAVMGGLVWFKGEQTSGTGGIARRCAAGALWAASGSFNASGCVDSGTVANIVSPWEFSPSGQLLRRFPNPPTITMGAAAGTSPPAAAVGPTSNSSKGSFTVGSGTSPPAAPGILCRVTYAEAYPIAPVPTVTAFGLGGHNLGAYVSAITTTYFEISVATAPAASQANTTYGFLYTVDG